MSLLDIFRKKIPPGMKAHQLDDVDREISLQTRQIRAEIKREIEQQRLIQQQLRTKKFELEIAQQEAELEAYKEEFGQGDPDELETQIMQNFLMPKLQQKQQGETQQQVLIQNPDFAKISVTDEELKQIMNNIPRSVLKMARKIQDVPLKKLVAGYMPGVNDDTLNRAVLLLKS